MEDLSRRELFTKLPQVAGTAAAVAAMGGLVLSATGCSSSDESSEIEPLAVKEDQVVTLESFTEVEEPKSCYTVHKVATLDAGKILFSSDGKVACSLSTGETASPLSTIEILNLAGGRISKALNRAIGHSEGFEIFEVRCSSSFLLWVESNYLTGDWRVYCAKTPSSFMSITSATLLDEGDIQYDAPELAVCGDLGYWIVQPAEDGDRTTEDSYLKVSGGAAATIAHTSHGRFNGGLSVSGNSVTAMPRVDTSSGVYYQPTAFVAGAAVDSIILPHGFRPKNAIYLNNAFAFDIPAAYDYGEGISHVGTYYPIGDGTWLRLTREPVTPPGFCNGWYFCKSGSRTVFVDITGKRYFTVNAPSSCADYGDYSVQQGVVSSLYNYATINSSSDDGPTSKIVLRRITLKEI